MARATKRDDGVGHDKGSEDDVGDVLATAATEDVLAKVLESVRGGSGGGRGGEPDGARVGLPLEQPFRCRSAELGLVRLLKFPYGHAERGYVLVPARLADQLGREVPSYLAYLGVLANGHWFVAPVPVAGTASTVVADELAAIIASQKGWIAVSAQVPGRRQRVEVAGLGAPTFPSTADSELIAQAFRGRIAKHANHELLHHFPGAAVSSK